MGLITNEDPAISAIKNFERSGRKPTFAWLKQQFGRVQISEEVYRSLDRGRAICQSVDQLDQYLYSYAPMVTSQWQHACAILKSQSINHDASVIDYGCGQGLAGLLMHDCLGSTVFYNVQTVTAIEPSAVALRRAAAVYKALIPAANVVPVNKSFSEVESADLGAGAGGTLHVFSNVLDIDGYDHVALLRKALRPGMHTIVAVGHDRTSHGYSQGMNKVKEAVESGAIRSGTTVHASGMQPFVCGNRGVPAVLWLAKLEVSDG